MKTQKQLQASFSDLEKKPDKVFPETREIIYLSNRGSRLNLVLFSWKKLCILSYTTTENRKLRSGTRISEYLPSPLLFAYWPYFLFYYSEDNFSLNFPWAEVHNIDCWLLEGISPSGAPSLHCKFKTQVRYLGCLNCPAEGIKSSGFRWCGPMNPWAIRIILPSNGPLKSMRMSSQCLSAVGQHTAFQESFWGEE